MANEAKKTEIEEIQLLKKRIKELEEEQEKTRLLFTDSINPIAVLNKDAVFLMVSQSGAEKLGLKPKDIIGRPVRDFFPAFHDTWVKRITGVLESGQEIRVKDLMALPGGERWFWTIAQPLKDKNGIFFAVKTISYDITDRENARIELEHSEIRFRELFNTIKSGVAIYEAVDNGRDFKFKDFNNAGLRIEKVNRNDVIGRCVSEVFPGVKGFGLFEVFRKVYQTGESLYHPISLYQDDRLTGWRENHVYKLPSGEVVAVYDDITEAKQAELKIKKALEEKEILLREVYHRVKNNLQIISSLITMQIDHLSEPMLIRYLSDLKNRIRSMALIHEWLLRDEDLASLNIKEYLASIIEHLIISYQINPAYVTVQQDIQDISIDIDTALPCGLIVNEIISNSFKHAFPGKKTGQVYIKLFERDQVYMEVGDTGVGFTVQANSSPSQGLGVELIDALVMQLEGTCQLQKDNGTHYKIKLKRKNRGGRHHEGKK